MKCRVCDLSDTYLLLEDRGINWYRCLGCGSDSSDRDFTNLIYGEREARVVLDSLGSMEACIYAMNTNLDWFDRFEKWAPEKSFLDVGTNEGAAMIAMKQRGWKVDGFDVNPQSAATVVADHFLSKLMPQQYGAVMCREVIEHVPDWSGLLEQITFAAMPGALVQIQTPRPFNDRECSAFGCVYAPGHLQIFSPYFLRTQLERLGLIVLEHLIWEGGQAWMCKK